MAYVEGIAPSISPHAVLEVGSYNVNGSVRHLFPDTVYTGVDVREGPGVDKVVDGESLPFLAGCFDTVISTEMLEHDPKPWRTVSEMARVLRADGTLILTARGYDARGCYEIHDWRDCWRFSLDGMKALIEDCGLEILDLCADPDHPGVFVTARKP